MIQYLKVEVIKVVIVLQTDQKQIKLQLCATHLVNYIYCISSHLAVIIISINCS